MKELLNIYKNGSAREKLAIISDLASIVGVSVVTLISAPILEKMLGIQAINIVFFTVYILMCVALFILSIGFFQRYGSPFLVKHLPYGNILVIIVYLIFLLIAWGGVSMFTLINI